MKRILILTVFCLLALISMGCRKMVTGDTFVLRSGETISGDMMVTGGDSTLEQGSRVTGSLIVTGGSVRANGQIDGNVTLTGGNISFGPSAAVRGALNQTGGRYTVATGASVRSSDSFGARTVPSWIGNLAGMLIVILLVIAVVILALFGTRASRGPERQISAATQTEPSSSASASASSDSVGPPAPGQILGPTGRAAGLSSGIVWGVILIALGALFLLQEILNLDVWHYAWPFLLIVPGLLLFAAMALGGKNSWGLALPGSILTMAGLILLYQNTFDRFESWAYAWALIFPTSIGIGRFIGGWWSNRLELRENGLAMIRWGLVLFLILAAFFEMVINLGGFFTEDFARIAFPALLILIGVLLLLSRFIHWPTARPPLPG